MNKDKLKQIICAGAVITASLNMIPALAYQQDANDGCVNIQMISDVDDEDFEEDNGKIIVKHIDVDTGLPISPGETYTNLSYGPSTVSTRLNIPGYTLQGSREQNIVLSASNPTVTVVFKYKSTKPPVVEPDNNAGSGSTTEKPSTGGSTNDKPNTDNNATQKPSAGETDTQKPNTGGASSKKPSSGTSTQKPSTNLNKEEDKVVLGTVTINYVDINSGKIFKTIKKDKLSLKSHMFTATEEDGYTLKENSSKTVTLSKSNTTATIEFGYIKNDSIAKFSRARVLEAIDKKEDLVFQFVSGAVAVDNTLLSQIAEKQKEDLMLELKDELSEDVKINEMYGLDLASIVSELTLISNLNVDIEELNGKIVVTKEVDSKYNGKVVYLYALSDDKEAVYVGEKTVEEGTVTFDVELNKDTDNKENLHKEFFLSDVKIEEPAIEEDTVKSEIIENLTKEEDVANRGIVLIYAGVAVGVLIGAVSCLLKVCKKK